LGYGAMRLNTIGNNNIAIGCCTLYCNTGGSHNTAIGYGAMCNNITGIGNIAIGYKAHGAAVSLAQPWGNHNISIGSGTNAILTSGCFNVGIGFNALNRNCCGYCNVAIGPNAMQGGTNYGISSANVALGVNALLSTACGYANIGIGQGALSANVSGCENIAIGDAAMLYNTGSYNIAIGTCALFGSFGQCTCTLKNVAIGCYAGCAIILGNCNTIIGGYGAVNFVNSNSNVILATGAGTVQQLYNAQGAVSFGSTSSFGSAGQILTSNGPAAAPAWSTFNISSATNFTIASLGVSTPASGTAGEIRATNNITAYYSSDARFKTNIEPIRDAVSKVQQISGVAYDWTDEYITQHGGEDGYFIRKRDIGLIAQEIEKILPEIVVDRADGSKAIKYERVSALLVEAIKELAEQIKELKAGR